MVLITHFAAAEWMNVLAESAADELVRTAFAGKDDWICLSNLLNIYRIYFKQI